MNFSHYHFFKTCFSAHMLLSTAVGFVVGAVVLVLYMETKQFNTLFLNNALVVGSLVACCILFSPLSKSYVIIFILVFF